MKAIRRRWQCNAVVCYTLSRGCLGALSIMGRKLPGCPTSRIPPSHRRRGATAVLVRHKPQWHRHGRHGSAVVPSLIVVAPRKTVKTVDLRGGTAATLNMFRRTSAVLVPSHRRSGATAVLVRHKPQWHRHDRRGSVIDRRSTAENCQNCGPPRGHGGNFEHVHNFRNPTTGWANPQWDRRGTVMTAVAPP